MDKQSRTSQHGLLVLSISADEWRVSDPRRREDDALCLVGFVQRVGDAFETTLIARPSDRDYFPSLRAAIDHLADVLADTSSRARSMS